MTRLAEISKLVAAVSAAVPAMVAQGFVSSALGHIITGVCGVALVGLATFLAPKNKKG